MIKFINKILIRSGLRFRKINQDDPNQVSERIKSLESINLKYYSTKSILLIIQHSFSIPVNIWPQVRNHYFYRGQICPVDQPFANKSRISYNPTPGRSLGRANLPLKKAFYASSALDTAAIESCQDELRNTENREFDLTIGEWELTKDIEASIICHADETQKVGTDIGEAVAAIEPLMRQGKTEEQFQALLKTNIFFAKQSAKNKIKHNNDYLFSALCANTILTSHQPDLKPDALWFPSVAYKYKGFNVVFKTQLIDDTDLILKRVFHLRIKFSKTDEYPQITNIKESANLDGDLIIW